MASSSEDMVLTIEDVYEHMRFQLIWAIGIMVGILITGGLMALGISCIFLLSRNKDPETLKQHRLLRVYIVALLLLVPSFIIVNIVWCNAFVILYFHSSQEEAERSNILITLFGNLTPVFVAALTDGLLVWRCWMIREMPLRHDRSWWQNIFWIFPAFLWSLTFVTGCIAAPLIAIFYQNSKISGATRGLQLVATLSNAVLNIYATLFISFKLLNHKRMMVKFAGKKVDTSRYTGIVNILLESAAINVPITIAVAVGIGLRAEFVSIVVPIMITGQALASVIIIYRVVVGRTLSQTQEEELNQFIAEEGSTRSHSWSTDMMSLDT